MKPIDLNAINLPQQTKTQRTDPGRPKELDRTKLSPVSQPADQIRVSNHVDQLVARAKGFDEVRQLHIESLRSIIESGQYEVSSREIAAAILREEN